MLLLVLILVLIAFGLLVVAWLTGSVLWAWVSVGVSVAAAAVLMIDWMMRRSAVRAGSDAVATSGGSAPGYAPPRVPEPRPVPRPSRSPRCCRCCRLPVPVLVGPRRCRGWARRRRRRPGGRAGPR